MSKTTNIPKYLTISQVAEELNKHPSTIYDWVAKGHIPSFRIGRSIGIRRVDLDAITTPKMSREEVLAG